MHASALNKPPQDRTRPETGIPWRGSCNSAGVDCLADWRGQITLAPAKLRPAYCPRRISEGISETRCRWKMVAEGPPIRQDRVRGMAGWCRGNGWRGGSFQRPSRPERGGGGWSRSQALRERNICSWRPRKPIRQHPKSRGLRAVPVESPSSAGVAVERPYSVRGSILPVEPLGAQIGLGRALATHERRTTGGRARRQSRQQWTGSLRTCRASRTLIHTL